MTSNYKKFILADGKPPIYFRPGTSDEIIIDQLIVKKRGYLFAHLDARIVFDIGSNIGVAALVLADVYPNAVIHCFEPEKENFELFQMNTDHLEDRLIRNNLALSNYTGHTTLFGSADGTNHGGFSMEIKPTQGKLPNSKIPVARTRDYIGIHGHPDVVKIDCEGAEYDILADVPHLDEILWITGELHNVKSWKLMDLLADTHEIQTSRSFGAPVWDFTAANRSKLFNNIRPGA